jgi:glycosyltransferase involved in cell wall biosynthesis
MNKISIIVPAYNEEENLAEVLEGLKATFHDCEIVVVDDGSLDGTYEIARSFFPETTLRHNKNRGLGAAIKTGIRGASGDFVIIVDADGQHPSEAVMEIKQLLREDPELDAVLTERENVYTSGRIRTLGKLAINFVTGKLTGERIRDVNCGLRAFRRKKILPFLFMFPDGFSFSTTSTVLAYKEDFKFRWVRFNMVKRERGKSQVKIADGFGALILVFRLIVLFDPLRFFVPLTVYSFLLGGSSILLSLITSGSVGENYIFFFLFASLSFILGLLSEQVANIRKELVNGRNDH